MIWVMLFLVVFSLGFITGGVWVNIKKNSGISFVPGGVEIMRFTDEDTEPSLAFRPVAMGFYETADGRIHRTSRNVWKSREE